jgi:hypothetical protein
MPITGAWRLPSCTSVTGAAPVTFTSDGGLHRAPIATPVSANYFTYGVVALSAGSTLAAVVGSTTPADSAQILFSTDAGCSWQPSGQMLMNVDYYLSAELATAGGYAYVWSTANRAVHVIKPYGVARPLSLEFEPWVSGPYGFAVDPDEPTRIRISMYDCLHRASCGHGAVIMETTDEGKTWTQIGVPAPYIALNMRFSPRNLDHVVVPHSAPAGHVTFDGGHQWLPSQGVPAGWRADEAAIGADGQTVWLLVSTATAGSSANAAAMYVSHDGGMNYQEAFAASTEQPFVGTNPIGDPLLYARIFPHPSDADVVYLAYTARAKGTSYLYRYDAALDELLKQQWPSTEGGVWALSFNPHDPDLLYLGLSAPE